MNIVRTDSFKRDFQRLSEPMKRSAEKALRFFVDNPRHRSLRTKKMGGPYQQGLPLHLRI